MSLNATVSVAAHKITAASIPLFLLAAATAVLHGQTLTFNYAQTNLPTAGLSSPESVAFDAVGDVYVNELASTVAKVPVNGGYPVSALTSSYPYAVDSAGNVFVINGPQVLKQPLGAGAAIPVGTFTAPAGVAVDGQNNVYVVDNCGTPATGPCYTLSKIASDGAGAQTQILVSGIGAGYVVADKAGDVFMQGVASIIELPAGGGPQFTVDLGVESAGFLHTFTVDGAGNIYFSLLSYGNHNNALPNIFEKPVGGGALITYGAFYGANLGVASNAPTRPEGMVVDSQGTVYIADSYSNGVREIQRTGSVNFQNLNVCPGGPAPCTETATLFFTETGTVTFGTPRVLSGGQPSSDFTVSIVAGGSIGCGEGSSGGASGPCALVTFTPQAAGLRTGTVQIVDSVGNVLSTVNVSGNGINLGVTPFITAQTPGTLRNGYTGLVGFEFTVGAEPLTVYELGYLVNLYQTGGATLELVQANGVPLPGGSTSLFNNTVLTDPATYNYAFLNVPVTLLPNTSYYLVAQEYPSTYWYDYGPVVSTPDATVIGPAYADATGNFVTGGGLPGRAYGPLNFLYTAPSSVTPLGVTIASPTGGTVTGTVAVTVSTSGAVSTLQLQVDGVNYGSSVAPSAISLDTTQLTNGAHTLTVVGSDTQSHTVTSAPVSVSVSNQASGYTPFVVSTTKGTLRNNYTGFVGFSMTVGSTPVVVSYLGRYVAATSSGTHVLKLVNSNGTDLAGGSVSLSLAGAPAGAFSYAALANAITLQPNTSYFLVSQETAGGDQWYDYAPVSTTSVASVTSPAYLDGVGHYITVSSFPGYSYVPLSFEYGATSTSLSVTITSPQAGAVVSGTNVPVVVTATQSVTSLQLLVDGVNQGSPVSSSPLTLDPAILSNGTHTLTVSATVNGASNAVSASVSVIVNNGGTASTAFITGATPSTTRNNYGGFVGTQIKVGSTPLSVTALGRLYVSGNSGSHTVKLVQANGTDLPGASVSVAMAGGTAGQFVYATLANPVSLAANNTYYLVSQETVGGDLWYDFEKVTTTSAATILSPTYIDGTGAYITVSNLPGYSYVPVSFLYQ